MDASVTPAPTSVPAPAWSPRDLVAMLALAVGVFLAGAASTRPHADLERSFHVELSRRVAEVAFVRELPQLTDTSWSSAFVDTEFLFHVATALAFALGQATGVVWLCRGLGALVLCLSFAGARRWLSPLAAFAVVVATAASCEDFLSRLESVRGSLVAQALMVGLIIALLRRSERAAGVLCALAALASHALYLPLLVLVLFALVHGKQVLRTRRVLGWALGGLALGLLVNPYFPDSLSLAARLIGAELKADGPELATLTTREFVTHYAGPLLVLSASTLAVFARPTPVFDAVPARFVFAVAFALWSLSAWTPSVIASLLPATVFAAAVAFEGLSLGLLLPGGLVVVLTRAPFSAALLHPAPTAGVPWERQAEAIPREAGGHKVLNCTTELGTFLFGARPDLGVVDALDPAMLARERPDLATRRTRLCGDEVVDAAGVVGSFRADYVITRSAGQTAAFEHSTDFERLTSKPARGEDDLIVYRLAPSAHAVRTFSTAGGPRVAGPSSGSVAVGDAPAGGCVSADVPAGELAAHLGADVALIGGGPRVRLLVDGAPVFDSGLEYALPRRHRLWVRLPGPLTGGSAVRLELCGAHATAALELWKADEVRAFCRARQEPFPSGDGEHGDSATMPCVVPWAARAAP